MIPTTRIASSCSRTGYRCFPLRASGHPSIFLRNRGIVNPSRANPCIRNLSMSPMVQSSHGAHAQNITSSDPGLTGQATPKVFKKSTFGSGEVSHEGDKTAEQKADKQPSQSDAFADLAHTKVRNAVKDDDGNLLRVSISKTAAEKLRYIQEQDKNPDVVLRISVESGGCHGFQYIFSLKDKSDIDLEEDGVFERNGATVVLDATSLEVLRDATVDYTTELIGSQFKVTSPYTDSTCGCGSSFSFDPSKIHQKE